MTSAERPAPALTVETVPLADPGPLVSHLDGTSPLLWRRRGFGMSGHGECLRLTFSGPDRFVDAARMWRALAAAARVDDAVQLPGSGLVAFGAFAFDDFSTQTSVLVVPRVVVGRSERGCWLTRIRLAGEDAPDAPHLPISSSWGDAPQLALVPGELGERKYVAAVARAVELIRSGALSKVVVARDLVGQLPAGSDLRPVIASLAESYPDCWTYAIDGFFGSSPETLVSVHSGRVTARVLAGSAARGGDAASDDAAATRLATSHKDQDEHAFAVHNVLASLRAHSPAVTASEVPFTLKLPNLWHLASDVEGSLSDDSSSLDLLSSLHPTAAVGGTPTAAAVTAIRELEGFDRGRFAGPVGWVAADGDGEWAIALRGAQASTDGTVTAWAGAGVVAESDPEHELVETRMKFRPVVEAFTPPDG